jgi:adenylate kinase
MLIDEVNKHPDTNGILFDGYPRTIAQAEALDAFSSINKILSCSH